MFIRELDPVATYAYEVMEPTLHHHRDLSATQSGRDFEVLAVRPAKA